MKQAILKTICYHAVFTYPLTPAEIWSHLVGPARTTWHRRDLIPILNTLVTEKIITTRPPNYYMLNSRILPHPPLARLIRTRLRRRRISQAKLALARTKAHFLTRLPGVRLVAVTGSLAARQAKLADDIDLLIVASSGQLWQTRLIITLVADLLRRRRRPTDTSFANQLCFNFYLDAARLTINRQKQNLYSAYELTTLIPLYDSAGIYPQLIRANPWVKRFQPHAYRAKLKSRCSADLPSPPLSTPSLFEQLSRRLQTGYMRHRLTTELITPRQLYFHPHDHSGHILTRYRQIYRRVSAAKPISRQLETNR